jgi:hypothetical protein
MPILGKMLRQTPHDPPAVEEPMDEKDFHEFDDRRPETAQAISLISNPAHALCAWKFG